MHLLSSDKCAKDTSELPAGQKVQSPKEAEKMGWCEEGGMNSAWRCWGDGLGEDGLREWNQGTDP